MRKIIITDRHGIISDERFGTIRYEWVSEAKGAWVNCRERYRARIVFSPYMSENATCRLRPGERVILESASFAGDYKGGEWGYNRAEFAAEAFTKMAKAPIKNLKKMAGK